jgi:hypothetical protein
MGGDDSQKLQPGEDDASPPGHSRPPAFGQINFIGNVWEPLLASDYGGPCRAYRHPGSLLPSTAGSLQEGAEVPQTWKVAGQCRDARSLGLINGEMIRLAQSLVFLLRFAQGA